MKRGHEEVEEGAEATTRTNKFETERAQGLAGEANGDGGVTPATPAGEPQASVAPKPMAAAAVAGGAKGGETVEALAVQVGSLKGDIATLEAQLKELQAIHSRLIVEHSGIAAGLPKSRPPHDPSWEIHQNPTNGSSYYFNKRTNASTYDKPADYNPRTKPDVPPELNAKGPPGANLFIVRKMRRGEFDDFDEFDLREAFSKYGTVMRCELTQDPATNWSRGFGFVSMSKAEESALVIKMLHGHLLAGKEMKIELTKEDGRS
ncbi:hypothetical protein T492DRAFT_1085115 [Pavlovales sp. CCMP2436]|nr:hypothetical protein T492DRAFT_1085115 [Pavlovales sp. CCMP2436]